MSDDHWYSFAATIRERASRERDWRAWFRRELTRLAMDVLDSDGEVRANGLDAMPTGRYRFAEIGEARARFPGAPWLRESACPYIGRVVGVISWDWWSPDIDTHEYFASGILLAGRGCLARSDGTGYMDFIVEQDFPLFDAAQKGGFHDGDFFWRDDPQYTAYVRQTIVDAVEKLGLKTELSNYGTSHNPHRIDQFIPRRGQTFASCWETFKQHERETIRLWGHNLKEVRSPAFEQLLSDGDA